MNKEPDELELLSTTADEIKAALHDTTALLITAKRCAYMHLAGTLDSAIRSVARANDAVNRLEYILRSVDDTKHEGINTAELDL